MRSTAYQRRRSTSSFGELEELGFGQLWQIQLLRDGAEAVLLDDLSAISFDGEANNLSLQIERLFEFDRFELREPLLSDSELNSTSYRRAASTTSCGVSSRSSVGPSSRIISS